MPTELSVEIQPDGLAQIVESVFGAMMGMEANESGPAWFPGGERLTAAVHLAGDWNGAVLLECDRQQACRFAGSFLSIAPPDTVDEVVRDVVGELANMIGGNLKCVLTRGIRLSMPSIVEGSDCSLPVSEAEIRLRLAFLCAEGPFWVTVVAIRP